MPAATMLATVGPATRVYRDPLEIVVARRPEDVAPALARIGAEPGEWAGYIAYEAGLALEPRLMPLAAARTGATGPLVWFARFAAVETIPADAVENWLERHGAGPGNLGPLDPQVSIGGYGRAFDRVQEAIRAGDIYQANLTFRSAEAGMVIRWRSTPRSAAMRAPAMAGCAGTDRTGTCRSRPNCSSR
jgi:para-aminobenzoate synthetase/4-amino-4-deoxychorismate lyase